MLYKTNISFPNALAGGIWVRLYNLILFDLQILFAVSPALTTLGMANVDGRFGLIESLQSTE